MLPPLAAKNLPLSMISLSESIALLLLLLASLKTENVALYAYAEMALRSITRV